MLIHNILMLIVPGLLCTFILGLKYYSGSDRWNPSVWQGYVKVAIVMILFGLFQILWSLIPVKNMAYMTAFNSIGHLGSCFYTVLCNGCSYCSYAILMLNRGMRTNALKPAPKLVAMTPLSLHKQATLVGLMLSDAWFRVGSRQNQTSQFGLQMSKKAYVQYVFDTLLPGLSNWSQPYRSKNSKGHVSWRILSESSVWCGLWMKAWYPNLNWVNRTVGTKSLAYDMVEWFLLNPSTRDEVILRWVEGDGYWSGADKLSFYLCTDSNTLDEVKFLCSVLNRIGLTARYIIAGYNKQGETKYRIRFDRSVTKVLYTMMVDKIHPDYAYDAC